MTKVANLFLAAIATTAIAGLLVVIGSIALGEFNFNLVNSISFSGEI
jgi:hypothetical protein